VEASVWQKCLDQLQNNLTAQQFNTWIRPLHAVETESEIQLLAPNRFVLERVNDRFIDLIKNSIQGHADGSALTVKLRIGGKESVSVPDKSPARENRASFRRSNDGQDAVCISNLNDEFTFDNFVEGKSNQLARAASVQVGENPGKAYNPLFIYGGVGLGKTLFECTLSVTSCKSITPAATGGVSAFRAFRCRHGKQHC